MRNHGVTGPISPQPISVAIWGTALAITTGRNPKVRRMGVVKGLMPMLPMNSQVSISPDLRAS